MFDLTLCQPFAHGQLHFATGDPFGRRAYRTEETCIHNGP
jgi:hypothetical protein